MTYFYTKQRKSVNRLQSFGLRARLFSNEHANETQKTLKKSF